MPLKSKTHNLVERIISAVLCLSCLTVAVSAPVSAEPLTQSNNSIINELDAIRTEREKLEIKMEELKQQTADSQKEIESIVQQIEFLKQEIAYQSVISDSYAKSVEMMKERLNDSKTAGDNQFEELKSLLRTMEEQYHPSFWDIVLGAESISDFIARSEAYNRIVEYEKEMLDKYTNQRSALGVLRYNLQEEELKYSMSVKEMEKEVAKLENKNSNLSTLIDSLNIQQNEIAVQLSYYDVPETSQFVSSILTSEQETYYLKLAQSELQNANLSTNEIEQRLSLLKNGLSLVGRVPYFWGGRVYTPGWNAEWNTLKKVQNIGNKSYPYGQMFPFGLDCSGFVFWATLTLYGKDTWESPAKWMSALGATNMYNQSVHVSWESKKPGDIVVNTPCTHIGFYLGKNEKGEELFLHCANRKGPIISTASACNFNRAANHLELC